MLVPAFAGAAPKAEPLFPKVEAPPPKVDPVFPKVEPPLPNAEVPVLEPKVLAVLVPKALLLVLPNALLLLPNALVVVLLFDPKTLPVLLPNPPKPDGFEPKALPVLDRPKASEEFRPNPPMPVPVLLLLNMLDKLFLGRFYLWLAKGF